MVSRLPVTLRVMSNVKYAARQPASSPQTANEGEPDTARDGLRKLGGDALGQQLMGGGGGEARFGACPRFLCLVRVDDGA